jgi:hypothetical protein
MIPFDIPILRLINEQVLSGAIPDFRGCYEGARIEKRAKPKYPAYNEINKMRVFNMRPCFDSHSRYQAYSGEEIRHAKHHSS